MDESETTAPFLSEINTRLRDIEEKNKLVRERVLLLGKNLLSTKSELENEVTQISSDNREIKNEIEKLKKISFALANEISKFAKRDEMYIIEKMLKDFQPLEFMRRKDVEELIDEKFQKHTGQQNKINKNSFD